MAGYFHSEVINASACGVMTEEQFSVGAVASCPSTVHTAPSLDQKFDRSLIHLNHHKLLNLIDKAILTLKLIEDMCDRRTKTCVSLYFMGSQVLVSKKQKHCQIQRQSIMNGPSRKEKIQPSQSMGLFGLSISIYDAIGGVSASWDLSVHGGLHRDQLSNL